MGCTCYRRHPPATRPVTLPNCHLFYDRSRIREIPLKILHLKIHHVATSVLYGPKIVSPDETFFTVIPLNIFNILNSMWTNKHNFIYETFTSGCLNCYYLNYISINNVEWYSVCQIILQINKIIIFTYCLCWFWRCEFIMTNKILYY